MNHYNDLLELQAAGKLYQIAPIPEITSKKPPKKQGNGILLLLLGITLAGLYLVYVIQTERNRRKEMISQV